MPTHAAAASSPPSPTAPTARATCISSSTVPFPLCSMLSGASHPRLQRMRARHPMMHNSHHRPLSSDVTKYDQGSPLGRRQALRDRQPTILTAPRTTAPARGTTRTTATPSEPRSVEMKKDMLNGESSGRRARPVWRRLDRGCHSRKSANGAGPTGSWTDCAAPTSATKRSVQASQAGHGACVAVHPESSCSTSRPRSRETSTCRVLA
mmetsp:Transcript_69770/g.123083  ORF Transcript_69770/g.123083 Transcript_69770/m.123083 type:complete len:208 (+) Transcript_69770:3134-3757(+)